MLGTFFKGLLRPLGLRQKKRRAIRWSWRKARRLMLWALGIFLGLVIILFAWFSKDLPTPGKVRAFKPAQSTQLFDRNGKLIYDIHGEERRIVIDKSAIPQTMKNATVAIEDRNFYKHHGVSLRAVARAVINNVLPGNPVQGGSTITQQYVKNALLTSKRTFARKIKELILSIEIEAMFSKDDILALYLNEIPYGANAYGVQAAAQTYFGKDAKDLTLPESAAIAALPQAPTYYSPYGTRKDALLARKNRVLDKMAEQGYITNEERDAARQEKLAFVPRREQIIAPHFSLYVKELLAETYGERSVEQDGLKVTTTLDLDKQKAAEEAVSAGAEDNLRRFNANNAALVAVDPKTGQILSMVGSADFYDENIDGEVNVTVASRQPGSSFKPLVYATAFKKQYNPAFTLWDLETDFGGGYVPQNFNGNFNGPVSMRKALGGSLNIPAVRTAALAGLDDVIDQAHAMGITTLNDRKRYGLSLALGAGEVRPLDMAIAFSTFATGGTTHKPASILKVVDASGKTLEEWKDSASQTLDPQIAFEINDILTDNQARSFIFGSNSPLNFADRTVAGKTGTSTDFRDAWTVGYTPSLATAVWVGNNNNEPTEGLSDGILAAAPIFRQYMDAALHNVGDEPFPEPEEVKRITVDRFSNKLPTDFSPETLTDWFTVWQAPKERDDVHVVVKVDKRNGKLAADTCPPSLVEERLVTNLHSEMPDKSNWEGPVRGWAQNNGITLDMPTETSDCSDIDPEVTITEPAGDSVTGVITIKAEVVAGAQIDKAEFFVDNILIGSDTSSPFSLSYDTANLTVGSHTIAVVATDKNGRVGRAAKTITVVRNAGPVISNVSAAVAGDQVTITWKTNVAADSQVEYGLNPTYGASSPLNQTMTKNHSVVITGLTLGKTYHYRARSRNGAGTLTVSGDFVFQT